MKPGFEPGICREVQITVTPDMCPAFDGIVVHPVYSTWSVAHHMELAARKVLVDYLEDHEEGIGAHISVDHVAPCPIGRRVCVRARLTEIDRHRVVCELTAHDGDRLLATGKQVQVVMPKHVLARLIQHA